jgi:hypothetical protein
MSLVNPNIALGTRLPEFQPRNALAEFAQLQQIQGGRQAQEMNALKMQEAQAAMQERNALRQLNPAAEDYENQLFRVNPTLGIAYRKERSAADASTAAAEASRASTKSSQASAAAARKKIFQQAQRDISGRPSDANIIAHMEDVMDSDLFTDQEKAEVERNTNRLLSIPLAERGAYLASQGASAGELKPTVKSVDIGGAVNLVNVPAFGGAPEVIGTAAKTMAPGEAQRLQNDATRIRQEGQRIGLEGRRVAVLEENNLRDADPAFQQRMGAARATGEAIAKGDVTAMQALPKVISRAEENIRLIDEMIGKRDSKTGKLIEGSKPHPGFKNAVGATWLPGARFIPGTDAASYMSRHDQIKGASFLEAFESLKGGGAITEKEGTKATDAMNRMSTATSENEYIRAALDLQDVIRKGVANAQARASRAGSSVAPVAPAAGGVIDFGSLR